MNDILIILGLFGFFGGVTLLCILPEVLAEFFFGRRVEAEEAERNYRKLERKIDIVNEAAAARKRGEVYTPPSDWAN